jgi:hypothetical protein
MRLPDFLVIGAMKAGTTSLCNDLASNSEIFFPSVKEPHTLVARSFEEESHYEEYRKLFVEAEKDQLCGEGSTGYAKLHKFERVPEKARAVLGKETKVIYIVRNPIDRIQSHHYHLYRKGSVSEDIDREVKRVSDLIEVSRYGMQIEPWIRKFGDRNKKIIKFENYITKRKKVIRETLDFLGVEANSVEIGMKKNEGEGNLIPPQVGFVKKILHSQFYKTVIHPSIPKNILGILKSKIYKKAPSRPDPLSKETVSFLIDKLNKDIEKISRIAGYDKNMWSVQEMYAIADRG